MKKVITYDLDTGLWETRVAHSNTVLSAGELEAKVVTCDITHWSDEQLSNFAASDRESQVFDLEQLEFAEWNRQWCAERDMLKAVRS